MSFSFDSCAARHSFSLAGSANTTRIERVYGAANEPFRRRPYFREVARNGMVARKCRYLNAGHLSPVICRQAIGRENRLQNLRAAKPRAQSVRQIGRTCLSPMARRSRISAT